MMLRRGVTLRLGLLAGALLGGVAGRQGHRVFPVPGRGHRAAGDALAPSPSRRHPGLDGPGGDGACAPRALGALCARLSSGRRRREHAVGGRRAGGGGQRSARASVGYLAYLWQVFLPRLPFMARHWETTNFPGFVIFVERGWGAFGWYDVLYPHRVYDIILAAMVAVPILGLVAIRRERPFVRRHVLELAILALMPLAVVAGVEAAFYTTGTRPAVAELAVTSSPRSPRWRCSSSPACTRLADAGSCCRRRPACRDDRPELCLAAADPDRVLCVR